MKTSTKSSFITGVVLLALAALFSISLILQLLDFGMAGPGHNNILFVLGYMLFSCYGFSSALIPAFLLFSGLSCFATVWTARKTMRLLTALVPFFTCVVTENICRSILALGYSDFSFIKLLIAIVTGALLVVIEYLGAGILADKISNRGKKNSSSIKFDKISKVKLPKKHKEKEQEPENQNFSEQEITDRSFDEGSVPEEEYSLGEPVTEMDFEEEADDLQNQNDEDSDNPKSIITQEEFAALTTQEENPEPADELEWPDLPPTPSELPPEYDADFDENDPALNFPPEPEEKNKADSDENDFTSNVTVEDSVIEESTSIDDDFDTVFDDNYTPKYDDSVIENPAYPNEISLFDDDDVHNTDADYEKAFGDDDETAKQKPLQSKFPRKIDLTDDSDDEDEELDNEQAPALIGSFDSTNPTTDENDDDEYQEDETLPFPAFGNPAASVFSDMEADIRNSQPQSGLGGQQAQSPASGSTRASGAGRAQNSGATNLTADELTDFFNAQQAENTPKTREIAPNPPKTSFAAKKGPYVIPSDLLTAYKDDQYWIIDEATKQASLRLKQTLAEFNIEADIIGIKKGPVVTMFEILPAPGVKLSKIVALQDNIALSLAAQSVRIVAPIPGKQAVGIEVPNKNRSVVGFREIIEMDLPEWKKMAVPVVLGKDILGKAQLIDLVKTPHMLIAGATGSGKSVCVNSLILSILYKRSFEDVKMILVDPKVVELKLYNNIPHLLTPVITEPKKAIQALQWCLSEMERRYALLDSMGVRDIANYNSKIKEQKICTQKLPYIVVIIDEFADLMATSGKELESIVARLTAMSRAVGIHLVLATQRPSVNVITGLIKANIPTRIAFMVASRTDSNIIIDTVGAEKLLGRGDMLFASAVDPAPIRIQGTFVSDQEVENVVTEVKEYGEPDYLDEEIFFEEDDEDDRARDLFGEPIDDDDPLYDQALEIVVQEGKASASYLQRRLKIGYNRAARLVEEMEERGIVGPANGSKPREVIHVP